MKVKRYGGSRSTLYNTDQIEKSKVKSEVEKVKSHKESIEKSDKDDKDENEEELKR